MRQRLPQLHPPSSKEQVFKWVFQIPDLQIEATERDAYKHLVALLHPFTGRVTQLAYRSRGPRWPEPPRNKYLSLMAYYKAVVEYIEANILLISLQIEEEILESLESIVKKNVNFEERYFLTDENSIRETIHSLENKDLSVVYNFVINFAALHSDVQRKIADKHYLDKKEHWAVHDEITDFILSKVQGYALIRKSYMPLYEDLRQLTRLKAGPLDFLRLKTTNIYKCLQLSNAEAFLNEINERDSDYFAYFSRLNQWLCPCAGLQDYALTDDRNNRVDIGEAIGEDASEKERFSNGIYPAGSSTLVNRLKHLAAVPSIDLAAFFEKLLERREGEEAPTYFHDN